MIPLLTYLLDGAEQLAVAVHDDHEGQHQAGHEQAHDVGNVVSGLGRPVHRAGGPGPLGAVTAPPEERGHGPEQGVGPGQDDAQGHFAVVGGVGLGGAHHGAVALVGKHGQRDQRHDA